MRLYTDFDYTIKCNRIHSLTFLASVTNHHNFIFLSSSHSLNLMELRAEFEVARDENSLMRWRQMRKKKLERVASVVPMTNVNE